MVCVDVVRQLSFTAGPIKNGTLVMVSVIMTRKVMSVSSKPVKTEQYI